MTPEPTTPIRIPKAAATYTLTTQDPDMRSQINASLLRDGQVTKIQETLLHALNASSTNWPDLVQKHALALLRSGDCTSFPALMARVLADIKADTVAARNKAAGAANGTAKVGGKSVPGMNGNGVAKTEGRGEDGSSLAVPRNVIEEGIKVTRECLDSVAEIVSE